MAVTAMATIKIRQNTTPRKNYFEGPSKDKDRNCIISKLFAKINWDTTIDNASGHYPSLNYSYDNESITSFCPMDIICHNTLLPWEVILFFSVPTKILYLQRILLNLFSHRHSPETMHIQRSSRAVDDNSFRREGRHRCYLQTPF